MKLLLKNIDYSDHCRSYFHCTQLPMKEWANARIKEEQEFQNHEIREYTT